MRLEVLRFRSREDATYGILYDISEGRHFLCYTLEDQFQREKVAGETRIAAGEYDIDLYTMGRVHELYLSRFPQMHVGMLHIQDVPDFEAILIHMGNYDDDTKACLLVGESPPNEVKGRDCMWRSRDAYVKIYPLIADTLLKGNPVTIRYVDYDSPDILT